MFSDDTVGSNNGATYQIDFITGHNVPYMGAVSLYLPTNYISNFKELGTTCSLYGFSEKAFCKIIGENRVDIRMNGDVLKSNLEYRLILKGMSNPLDPTGMEFTLVTYYN